MIDPPPIPSWRPDRLSRRLPLLAARGRILRALRRWFDDAGFVEVETPALQVSPGMEVHLKAFATEIEAPDGRHGRLYLHTSPEFAMKKLLAGGVPLLFQLARVWRNGERSDRHHPEFTMLEWYRAEAGYESLMDDCEALLRAALAASGGSLLRWQGATSDPARPFERLAVAEAFQRYAGIDLLATAPDPQAPDAAALARGAVRAGIRPRPSDTWEDIFFRVMLEHIEPRLGFGRPTILYDYPVSMAALSRPKPGDPRLAERFELYVCGLELANAFGELTDAAVQRRRFEADMAMRRALYGEAYPVDEDFLAALEHGLPPSAGIALGFDRLVMLATGATRIEDVLWLPVAAP
ncbi:EF-P lysine aminoacylase GenX [Vineibacter terrae]|uniref:EF-P lysine aminoacylase GenX n=1 Tax=Vineibacter terrae TaxID=2586908 RepID=A0A5C8P881_9HYPH|nr:EF-P lysine aminoacylase EpmA [Vineibacter terrae]TXL69999.1 EF-P lysine aminoacylase GenX [Vineibacter terrae]